MSPLPQPECHDAPWLLGELVPGVAAVVDDVVVGPENAVREPVVTHELPDVLDGPFDLAQESIEFGTPGWQRYECYVWWHDQFGRAMPSRLVEQDDRVRSGREMKGDLLEMHAHRFAVALGHDDASSPFGEAQDMLAFSGADRAKYPYRGTPLILWR